MKKTTFQIECEKKYKSIKDAIESSEQISLFSSGTTGIPKKILKKVSEDFQNKRGIGSKDDVWLLTYSPDKWAAISVFIHCLKNDSKIVFPESLNPKDLISSLSKATHVSLTPSMFTNMTLCDLEKQYQIKQITFGGEYATQMCLDLASDYFPNARITHMYATSEIGDICSCSDGKEGFPVKKIKNFRITNDELFIEEKGTGDIWEEKNERLYFKGRVQDVVNIGAETINLHELERYIIEKAKIIDAKCYTVKAPIVGNAVCLDYVGDLEEDLVKSQIASRFSKYHVPIFFRKVEKIELTQAGKRSRK